MRVQVPAKQMARLVSDLHVGPSVYVHADEKTQYLTLESGNFEYQVRVGLPAVVEASGALSVPSKQFLELVSALSLVDETLVLSEEESSRLVFTLPRARYALRGSRETGLFLPEVEPKSVVRFPTETLVSGLRRVLHACTKRGEVRYDPLGGVHFVFEPERTLLVATDTYRLARMVLPPMGGAGSFSVPAPALVHLLNLCARHSAGEVELGFTEAHARFRVGDATLTVALLQGKFPNYEMILAKREAVRVRWEVPTHPLMVALKRLMLLARSEANRITLSCEGGRLMATANAAPGKGWEPVPLQTGDETAPQVAFNGRYLQEMLDAVGSERVVMEIIGDTQPVFFQSPESTDYVEVIMPMMPFAPIRPASE